MFFWCEAQTGLQTLWLCNRDCLSKRHCNFKNISMKKILIFLKTEYLPYVNFNGEKGIFEIKGKSFADDDQAFLNFYHEITVFLENYKKTPQPNTNFYFNIEYLDDISYGYYFVIFQKIVEIQEFSNVSVTWYFENDDQEEQGAEYLSNFSILQFYFVKK